jgi:YebC/PmpR family DNA-binding regulatory protein
MGRIFETRKATMFARWDKMSKAFARIGKEITIAVKKGGPNPDSNPSLRRVIQNSRAVNMPKDKVENAIKKASGQDQAGYDEILYEGYGPHGAAILVECATDNIVRTVANIRHIFTKGGGNMGTTNSVSFQFKHMGVFRLNPAGLDAEALELDLIDFGLEEMGETVSEKGEPQLLLRCAIGDFGHLAKALEDRKITPISSELEYVPQTPLTLPDDQGNMVLKLVDMLEQDEDVQKVYHNLA